MNYGSIQHKRSYSNQFEAADPDTICGEHVSQKERREFNRAAERLLRERGEVYALRRLHDLRLGKGEEDNG